ncbi:MAG: hypothetical protein IJW40_07305 [Clostridia bacterium]|nr:hypothetical protein [Clostridia bacterium]
MKLIGYELKKIFALPLQRGLCLILLAVSLALSAATVLQAAADRPPQRELDALLAAYEQDSATVMTQYAEREQVRQAYKDAIARMSAEEAAAYPEPSLPDLYATDEAWTDDDLYAVLLSMLDSRDRFGEEIQALLQDSYGKYQAYLSAGTINRAALELQYQYINHYRDIGERVSLPLSRVIGWDSAMLGVYPDLICGLIVLLLICPLFSLEKSENFYAMQRVCRRGRMQTVAAKLTAAALCAVAAVLVVALTTLAAVALTGGLSDPAAPVQLIDALRYCPWTMTVGQYYLLTLGLKLFAFVALAMLACAFSSLAARGGQSLFFGLLLWGGVRHRELYARQLLGTVQPPFSGHRCLGGRAVSRIFLA